MLYNIINYTLYYRVFKYIIYNKIKDILKHVGNVRVNYRLNVRVLHRLNILILHG